MSLRPGTFAFCLPVYLSTQRSIEGRACTPNTEFLDEGETILACCRTVCCRRSFKKKQIPKNPLVRN